MKYLVLIACLFMSKVIFGGESGEKVTNGDSIKVTVAPARGTVYMCRHAMPITLAIQNISQNDVEVFSQQPDFPGLTFTVDPDIRLALGIRDGTALTEAAGGTMPSVIIKPTTTSIFNVYLDRYLIFPLPSSDVFAIKWKLMLSLNGDIPAIKEGTFTAQIFDEKPEIAKTALERYLADFQRAVADDDIQKMTDAFFGLYGTTSDMCIPYLGRIHEGPFKTMAIQALEHHSLTSESLGLLQRSIDSGNASAVTTALNVLAYHRVVLDEKRVERLISSKDEIVFRAYANYSIRMSKLLNINRLVSISKGSDPKDERRATIAKEALKEIFVGPIPQEGFNQKVPATDPTPPKAESANGF